jgi:glyoxylase-like metal-dependent hydrolase (beta-lactamase superfamily II)
MKFFGMRFFLTSQLRAKQAAVPYFKVCKKRLVGYDDKKDSGMLIDRWGSISEHIDLLGSSEIPFYLVRGQVWALIDSGVSPAIPALFDQFKAYPDIDARLKYIILTHSHFDHAGGLGFLLARFPKANVLASATTAEVFKKPKAVEYILGMNDGLARFAGIDFAKLGYARENLRVDEIVKEGDRIELGNGVNLEVYDAPGHSRCSLAYVLNPDRALFSGEAIGFYNRPDQILPEALSSFKDFIATLEKLSRLKLKMLCLPHGGALFGDELKNYFPLALDCARRFRAEFSDRLKKGQPEKEILDQMTAAYYQGRIRLQPEQVFRGNLQAMLAALKKES